jgi:hypothetical protein
MKTVLVTKTLNPAEIDISKILERKLLLSREIRLIIGKICGTGRGLFDRLHGFDI